MVVTSWILCYYPLIFLIILPLMVYVCLDLVQTDPNWSNFLYDDAKKLINLIDFGAARDYPKSFVDDYLRMVSFNI